MTISSRTPEGEPNRCRLCGAYVCVEPSTASGDAPCPRCGQLLWFLSDKLGVKVEEINRWTSFLAEDSLDVVELVMELKEIGATIPEEEIARIKTVGDAIDAIERFEKDQPEEGPFED